MFSIMFTFFKIALVSFGGGVIIPIIQKEFVETGILNANEFIRILAISQATPGPVAGGIVAFIGYGLYGFGGAVLSIIAIALPSFFISFAISKFLDKIKHSQYIEYVLKILRPINIALIIYITIFMIKAAIFNNVSIITLKDIVNNFNVWAFFIFLISYFLIRRFKFSPIHIIIISAGLGAIIL